MAKEKTVNDLIRPVSLVSAILGMGIFEYPLGYPRRRLSIIYSLSCLVTYCTMVYFSINKVSYIEINIKLKEFTSKLILFGSCGVTICSIFLSWGRTWINKGCIDHIKTADTIMIKLGIKINYTETYKRNVIRIVFVLIMFLVISVINALFMFSVDTPTVTKILITIILHYPIILIHIADYEFLVILRCMQIKFRYLNNTLKEILRKCNNFSNEDSGKISKMGDIIYVISSKSDYSYMIKMVRQGHHELMKICRKANAIFGGSILLSLCVSFLMVTGFIYNLYILFYLSKLPFNKTCEELVSICCWIFFYFTKIVCLTHICSRTTYEAMKTSEILTELSLHKEIRDEVVDFNLQMIQKPLYFTAYDFCIVDCSLIRNMSSTILTYLVILVQFSNSSTTSVRQNGTDIHNEFIIF